MPKVTALSLILVLASAPSAYAISGAQLVQADPQYGRGFVWGVASVLLSMGGDEESEHATMHRRGCLEDAGMTDLTMYQAAMAHIRNHPEAMTEPAFAAVANTFIAICGLPD